MAAVAIAAILPFTWAESLLKPSSIAITILAFAWVVVVISGWCYITARFFASMVVIVLENRGPIAAMRRSAALSRGSMRLVLAALGLAYGLYWAIMLPTNMIGARVSTGATLAVLVAISLVLLPLIAATHVLLYYEVRNQKEGLDILTMIQYTAPPSPASASDRLSSE